LNDGRSVIHASRASLLVDRSIISLGHFVLSCYRSLKIGFVMKPY
jgi:hypothetical protein